MKKRLLPYVLAQARAINLKALAESARVPYPWLHKLCAGKIHDPGVNRIERLYCTLTGKDLKL